MKLYAQWLERITSSLGHMKASTFIVVVCSPPLMGSRHTLAHPLATWQHAADMAWRDDIMATQLPLLHTRLVEVTMRFITMRFPLTLMLRVVWFGFQFLEHAKTIKRDTSHGVVSHHCLQPFCLTVLPTHPPTVIRYFYL